MTNSRPGIGRYPIVDDELEGMGKRSLHPQAWCAPQEEGEYVKESTVRSS